ncbi:hypothetical protein VOLCADRAFT_121755 [Volvox carteri f. nagariensis]|uniref:DNA mismatch repair proteins mutS family domain-containing protein n=1 Tax=Volvox carteri f. nagariensis TaxID=3068 RepID=D8UJC6_VOLCA|nr:uncharacterized protein VOLCADRAFT_121755 [Volvox carteri f. nagariensis]EFJ40148.1 hypothetical protein VOLCADRAFT_121755 [Volvox carteri f. nagariensis]|eukprot:XP_002958758.1 hypothetical protein VOLCADRAFT_121755 [Volvox carteri f. nagariensis]
MRSENPEMAAVDGGRQVVITPADLIAINDGRGVRRRLAGGTAVVFATDPGGADFSIGNASSNGGGGEGNGCGPGSRKGSKHYSLRQRVAARCGNGLDVAATAIFLLQPALAMLLPGMRGLGAVPGSPMKAAAILGALLLARRILIFRRWRDEHMHVPRFILCFVVMVLELSVENGVVWLVSAWDQRKYDNVPGLQDNVAISVRALSALSPAVRWLAAARAANILHFLAALLMLAFSVLWNQVPYSGFGIMSRVVLTVAASRVLRMACFLSTVLPNPRPGCYRRRFPPVPEGLWDTIKLGYTTIRGFGGCNDLIFSGHGAFWVLAPLAFRTYYPGRRVCVWVLWLALAQACVKDVVDEQHYSVDMLLAVVVTWAVWDWLAWVYPAEESVLPHRPAGAPADKINPAVVACFCGTSVAAELAARGQLPRGRSREESELLLQQTAEALEANIEVRDCFDIRPAVEAAAAGVCLNAKQLESLCTISLFLYLHVGRMQGVASTLESAFAVKAAATAPPHRYRYPSLAALAEGIEEEERTLLRAIRACIKFGSVCDDASESLAAVRAERQSNKERLRKEVEGWARSMQQRGAAEAGAVAIVRGRFCVGVRSGRQGELPRGSVRLSSSSSGATVYMEPQPCVDLNNMEAVLGEREEQEVQKVLGLLSKMLGTRVPQLLSLLGSVTSLDLVAARARHSRWMGATRPEFEEFGPGASPLHVPGALHPLLMQRGLPPLPQAPSVDDNRFDRDFQAAPAWELRRVVVPDGPRSGELPEYGSTTAVTDGGSATVSGSSSLLPRPLDLRVPPGKAVVAITGGKTVTLKAAGLMVLMAQAGLFLPYTAASGISTATHGSPPCPRATTSGLTPRPRLVWFDRVLADIGDAQSLQQNLSTFSGHIRRIRGILATAGPGSLVLLDEVGSGTDPLEGAALARAVLDRLAGQARLTLATTHHAELKRAAEEDGRYVNVSMAFDTASLRPTYRLCWGAAGASNALDIAEALGFDRQDSHIAVVARSLVRQLDETRQELEAQRALRQRLEAAQSRLQETVSAVREMERQLKLSPREIVMERDTLAAEVQTALDAFAAGLQPQASVEEALSRIEALIPEEVAAYRGQGYSGGGDEEDMYDDRATLRPGDPVHVKPYGDMGSAKVVSVKGDYVTVRFDALPFSAGARSGRSRKFHKREVQRVGQGSVGPLLGTSPWMSEYSNLDTDIRRVLGEVSAEERRAAAEAAARLRSQQLAEEAGHASYSDLYDALDVDDVADDLDAQIDDPDLDSLVDSLAGREQYEGEEQEQNQDPDGMRGHGYPGYGKSGRGGDDGASRSLPQGGASGKKPSADGRRMVAATEPLNTRSSKRTSSSGDGKAEGLAPPVQTEENTLDVVGEVPELAAADVDDHIRSAPAGSVFFVRHGMGTGAVRDAVQSLLAKRQVPKGRVQEWREAPDSRGEVTVVWL